VERKVEQATYVPGFWSWKGLSSTFFTLMMILYVLQANVDAIEAIGMFQRFG
jgi:hypothetical protein